jgi:hypothetical protein
VQRGLSECFLSFLNPLIRCEIWVERRANGCNCRMIVSSQGMVVLYLGGAEKGMERKFVVHRELLILHSNFFRDLLEEKGKETDVKREELGTPMLGQEVAMQNGEAVAVKQERKRSDGGNDSETTDGEEEKDRDTSHQSSLSSLDTSHSDESSELPDLKNTSTPQTQPNLPSEAGTTTPALVERQIPSLNPTYFEAFLSYIYTHQIRGLKIEQDPSSQHMFASLYLFASQLGSPGFMNYIMTQHHINFKLPDEEWPNPTQVRHICSTSNLPTGDETFGEGPAKLQQFMVACIAANNPYERYKPGSREYADWECTFAACPTLVNDAFREACKWVVRKPWEEGSRSEWMVEEKSLKERWHSYVDGESVERGVEGAM